MKISFKLLLPLVSLLTLPAVVQAQDFTYTTNNGTITITGYTGPGGAVAIPDTINGYPVTGIESNAFNHRTILTSITIPDSVTSIGDSAFYDCYNLANVTLGNNLTNIGAHAFEFAGGPTSLTITDGATIGDYAFHQCNAVTNVTLGNGPPVYSIGSLAFNNCTRLTSVLIGNSVTNIGPSAFWNCSSLIKVSLGNSVASLGDHAFYACGSLRSVTIPNNVTTISPSAFAFCGSLVSAVIGYSVTNIGTDAFYDCGALTRIYFQSNAPSVSDGAFQYVSATVFYLPFTVGWGPTLSGLYTAFGTAEVPCAMTINNGTISVSKYTGSGGAAIIPRTICGLPVISIGSSAFESCTNLTSSAWS